jgi:CMP-N,N'-diacetyllegionaminic acid synthase
VQDWAKDILNVEVSRYYSFVADDLKVLCVIPARGGSKSIPKKNLRKLAGKPLVAWPIEAALNCNLVTEVVCSSDSDEILSFAKSMGSNIHKRPQHLATDEADSPPVVLDVIEKYEKEGEHFDYVIMLEPTSPLTDSTDLTFAINCLEQNSENFDSLVTIAESVSAHPDFTFSLLDDRSLVSINQAHWKVKRRQDISKLYFIEGTLYLSKVVTFKKSIAFVQNRTMGMTVAREKSFEIDEELDFYLLEAIMKYQEVKKGG